MPNSQHYNEKLDRAIRHAAHAVTYEWPNVIEADDLAQELWVKVLESPATQELLDGKTSRELINLLARMGHRIASRYRTNNARFSNQIRYSVDDIKAALSGLSLWPEITDDIELGLAALRDRNERYAEAIQAFVRNEPPPTEADRKRRDRAIEALTEETNAAIRRLFDAYTPEPGKTLRHGPGTKRTAPAPTVDNAKNVFDSEFNSMPGIDMYRSWVEPDMYPNEQPARVENWSTYDREDCWNGS
ncbi:hypothetical protein [Nocardia brasiliensis]|uniref:hypothetical protein n=1 Tax=Nocardia brasiliensis TaxID=37326 RepID=UPI0024566AEA|nr:hypothetical protein [Nocardia brasiliensis]